MEDIHSFSQSINIWCVLQVQIQNLRGSLKSIVDEKKIHHECFITQAMFSMQLVSKMFNFEFSLLQK